MASVAKLTLLQLPQDLFLKINHLFDPPHISLPGGPVVG